MTFRLHKTTIYFKQFFASSFLNENSFLKLCQKINEFPLKEDYAEIKGLYLSGDHFFKKILLSEAKEVLPDDIRQIKSITPIIDHAPMPFNLEQNCFEVNIPTSGKSFEKLLESVSRIDAYLNDLLEDKTGKKIEIHLKGGGGGRFSHLIFTQAIPVFSTGNYQYESVMNRQVESGEMLLPTEFSDLPDNVRKLVKVIRGPYTLKLIDNKNKLILRQVKRQEIGLSLYSDQHLWFQDSLRSFKKSKLFEYPVPPPQRYHSLPHLTGSR
ncbi:hypothetical protein QUF75_14620 [Desulfococcaceae bacterium HSG7]|nr:hypothetical protein [Desulfococcaceae bacterium HSG7]